MKTNATRNNIYFKFAILMKKTYHLNLKIGLSLKTFEVPVGGGGEINSKQVII